MGRLLVRWPGEFQRRLIRLIQFQCRHGHRGLLADVPTTPGLAQLLNHLEAAAQNAKLPTEVKEAASNVVLTVNAPMSKNRRMIFHPAIDVPERQRLLRCFASWWGEVAEMIDHRASDDPPCQETVAMPGGFFESLVSKTVVMVLNMLVSAADRTLPANAFRRMAMAWPPLVNVQDLQPIELLAYLTKQLETISSAHLYHLQRLIEIATTKSGTPQPTRQGIAANA